MVLMNGVNGLEFGSVVILYWDVTFRIPKHGSTRIWVKFVNGLIKVGLNISSFIKKNLLKITFDYLMMIFWIRFSS